MKRFTVLVGLLAAACSGSAKENTEPRSTAADETPLSELPLGYAWVEQTLKAHPEVHAVTDFLALLPESFRNRFVLVYDSRAAQRACAEPDNPRAIFFNEGSTFVIGASNDNGSPDCHPETLELMQFDPATASFDFRSVAFDAETPALSEKNPAACTGCHGADPRPLWQDYAVWPGVYGQLDDNMITREMLHAGDELPPESLGFEQFMARRDQGIYRNLVWKNGRDTVNKGGVPDVMYPEYVPRSPYLRPNLAFGRPLVDMNDQRVMRIVNGWFESDPDLFITRRYLNECDINNGVVELIDSTEVWMLESWGISVPREIPGEVRDPYGVVLDAGTYGVYPIFAPLSPFVAEQAMLQEELLKRVEQTLPRRFWGYLPGNDPNNPTIMDIPRYPKMNDGLFLNDAVSGNAYVAEFDWLLQWRGHTVRGLFMSGDDFAGTGDAWVPLRGYLDFPEKTTDCAALKIEASAAMLRLIPEKYQSYQ